MQARLFDDRGRLETFAVAPFRVQLFKWIGNKQRFADEIIGYFPRTGGTYIEPFLGSGAVLATLAPERAVASDLLSPLIQVWQALAETPDELKRWYRERWHAMMSGDKVQEYEKIKAAFNHQPNGADLIFLSRACYGGVVRFRQGDGYMSTPCGVHAPVSPMSFDTRVDIWHSRTRGTKFLVEDFETVMDQAIAGDVVYCDPPYTHTQSILYGAQTFNLDRLLECIVRCKRRGVYVALSIDGTKRSGARLCDISWPDGLFEHEAMVNCGRSMLKRFQMGGGSLEREVVTDRLLLTY